VTTFMTTPLLCILLTSNDDYSDNPVVFASARSTVAPPI
jgi:hypothetical protein